MPLTSVGKHCLQIGLFVKKLNMKREIKHYPHQSFSFYAASGVDRRPLNKKPKTGDVKYFNTY